MDTEKMQSFCKRCKNRKMGFDGKGWKCGITDAYPDFGETCPNFNEDLEYEIEKIHRQAVLEAAELDEATGGLSSIGITNGIVAGMIFLFGGIIWLVAGLYLMNRLFFYAPILSIIGLVMIVRNTFGK